MRFQRNGKMETQLKFRAWDKSQKYMAYQGTPDLETLSSFMFHFADKEIMLFSGYLDKNRKDIFKNDIIKFSTGLESFDKRLMKVIFEFGCFSLVVMEHDGVSCICSKTPMCFISKSLLDSQIYKDDCDVMEVVGNIHENNIDELKAKHEI